MDMLTSLFPPAFPALALSHFVALLSPGPDFFLLMGYAIRYRLRGSAGLCIGIALGNGVYIAVAIVGWSMVRHAPLLFSAIALLGAAWLLWLGGQLWRSRPGAFTLEAAAALRLRLPDSCCSGWPRRCLTPKMPCFISR
nr:threonine efflux protein [Raoultella sp. NCTC 9187]